MRAAFLVIVSVALFIAAAKAHGRELRLEREAQGIHAVVFGGENPPAVEALWRAERRRFWVLAPLLAVALGAALWRAGNAPSVAALGAVAWAPVLAFIALGLLSAARTGAAASGHIAGSVGWWSLVLTLSGVAAALAASGYAAAGPKPS